MKKALCLIFILNSVSYASKGLWNDATVQVSPQKEVARKTKRPKGFRIGTHKNENGAKTQDKKTNLETK